MTHTLRNRTLGLFALALAVAGCSKSPTSPTSLLPGGTAAQQAAVASVVVSTPSILSDSLMDVGSTPALLDAGQARNGVAAAVIPRYWWRSISSIDRSFAFAFSDSDSAGVPRQADVTITRHMLGQLNFFKALASDSMKLDSANVVHKPIDETAVRHVRLRRMAAGTSATKAWFVTGASAEAIASNPATESIQSVRVQATGLDTTLTDPAALWTLPQLFHIAPGDSLSLTATTSHTDDVVLCYWHDRRERFHANGDGTYSFKLRLPPTEYGRTRFIGVNALSHGTLYDDTLPYDSAAWVFYCVVGRGALSGDHY